LNKKKKGGEKMSEEVKIVELINSNASPLWKLVNEYGRLLAENEIDTNENYWIEKAEKSGAILVIILNQDEDNSGVVAFDDEGMPVSI
jgi:histidyl-tRNA synthetase